MQQFSRPVQVRWSDLDPNFHVRHSVYYDWGAFCRVQYFDEIKLSTDMMLQHHIGPIIFREECIFRKEIRMEDKVTIDFRLLKSKRDYSRFSIRHVMTKNDGELCATLTVDIAWIDTHKRKLAVLPEEIYGLVILAPMAEEFQWID
jgi:acyl-CoA thioester hydrolase